MARAIRLQWGVEHADDAAARLLVQAIQCRRR